MDACGHWRTPYRLTLNQLVRLHCAWKRLACELQERLNSGACEITAKGMESPAEACQRTRRVAPCER
jgi:hypothetical protein